MMSKSTSKNSNSIKTLSRKPSRSSQTEGNSVRMSYSGPLPDGITFAAYERVVPGSAERLIIMAEKEQTHRHEMERILTESLAKDAQYERQEIKRSQWLAYTITIIIVCIGGWLTYTDHSIVGSILTGGTLLGIVSAFLTRSLKERQRKDLSLTPPKK